MALILGAAGGAGFLASFMLLRFNVDNMALRYPLAACVAYVVFMLLLGMWLRYVSEGTLPDLDPLDMIDVDDLPQRSRSPRGEHGGFSNSSYDGDWTPGFDVPGLDGDWDEAALLIIPVAIVIACLGAALYILYIAPALLAELLLEGVLLTGVYRRVKNIQPEGWYSVVFRRTSKPFLGLALVLACVGYIAQAFVPEARSIGDLFGGWRDV